MHTLLSFFAVLTRLLRPTRGAHTSPCGYLRELGAEARRNRSRRVRRYVETPARPEPAALAPLVPAPRKPLDDEPVDDVPQVELVRGPYLAWETRQAALRGLAA